MYVYALYIKIIYITHYNIFMPLRNIKNICFCFPGESFRLGGQYSRDIGSEESVHEQVLAFHSHCNLMQCIKEKYKDINIDIYIQTYSTCYDDLIHQIYDKSVAKNKYYTIISEDDKQNYNSINDIMNEILDTLDIDFYDIIFVIRIDLILKPFFTSLILSKNINELTFASIIFKYNNYHLYNHNNAKFFRLNMMITIIPNTHSVALKNRLVNFFAHEFSHILLENNIRFGFLLKTLHDADSYKDWNPLYRIANRKENQTWMCPSYYDAVTDTFIELHEMQKHEICDFNMTNASL